MGLVARSRYMTINTGLLWPFSTVRAAVLRMVSFKAWRAYGTFVPAHLATANAITSGTGSNSHRSKTPSSRAI